MVETSVTFRFLLLENTPPEVRSNIPQGKPFGVLLREDYPSGYFHVTVSGDARMLNYLAAVLDRVVGPDYTDYTELP